jgi:dolichyl-diphosphooligosaccharide--protein glycosyltransferase
MPHKITRFISAYIAIILIALSAICLYLRITPAFLGNPDFISFLALDDPIYHLRRIEQIFVQFPHHNWFEALTNYPNGTIIHWGPLFPLICTTFVLIMGAATRAEIVMFALLVPPLMAACMVPLSYFIGKRLLDWKAGLITALFIAFIPGQYYARSFYGYLDHHIAETLFSSLFCLCYILALWSCRDKEVTLRQFSTWKIPILYGLICGFAYFLGYANMPTMLLFGLTTSIFTLIWFIAERWMGKDGLYLAILNTVTFGIAIFGSILIGFPSEELGLNYYTIMNPLVMAAIIVATWVLFGLSYYFQNKSILHYIGSIAVCGIAGVALTSLALPSFFNTTIGAARYFFSAGGIWVTIMEARPWTFDDAWGTFSYSILFFILGLLVCSFLLYRKKHPIYCFTLIWALLILCATSGQIRYEYYLAVPISVLSGLFFGFLLNTTIENINNNGGIKRALKTKNATKRTKTILLLIALIISGIVGGMFIYNAFLMESKVQALNLNPDWRVSLMWMEQNTPDTGID